MSPNIDSMAQKEANTDNHPARPPSGKVKAEDADMREATRSGNLDGGCEAWWFVVDFVWALQPLVGWLLSCFSRSSFCWASRLIRASSSSWCESSFSKSPSAETSDLNPSVLLEEKVSRQCSCLNPLSSALDDGVKAITLHRQTVRTAVWWDEE